MIDKSEPIGVDWNAEVARYLPLAPTADAARGQLVVGLCEAAQAALEESIGRTFARVDYTESYDGNGRRWLYLRHDPIRAVSSVTIGGGTYTFDSPEADPVYPTSQITVPHTLDCLEMSSLCGYFPRGSRNVIVSYTAGLARADGVPRALLQATVLYAAFLYRERDRLGISSQSMNQVTTAFDHKLPDYVNALVLPYRRLLGSVD